MDSSRPSSRISSRDASETLRKPGRRRLDLPLTWGRTVAHPLSQRQCMRKSLERRATTRKRMLSVPAELDDYDEIVDDLLDVTQSSEHIGKATGKDQSAGKLTFPGLFGIDASRQKILTLQTHALESIKPLGPPAAPLGELCNYLAIRTR